MIMQTLTRQNYEIFMVMTPFTFASKRQKQ